MAQVQAALRVFAKLFGFQQAIAQAGERIIVSGLARGQGLDFGAKLLDFALARQRALLRFAAAKHANPTLAEPFAGTGDHRFGAVESGEQGTCLRDIIGDPHACQQTTHRCRPAHSRGQ